MVDFQAEFLVCVVRDLDGTLVVVLKIEQHLFGQNVPFLELFTITMICLKKYCQ